MTKDEDQSEAIAVVETVEKKTEVTSEDAKQAAGSDSASASLTNTLSSAKANTGDVLATLKAWSQTAGNAAGAVFSTLGTWKEEGDTKQNERKMGDMVTNRNAPCLCAIIVSTCLLYHTMSSGHSSATDSSSINSTVFEP